MFRHYLTVSFRHIGRQKAYALINVFGLAVGIAACWLIFLYVQHEFSYDAFQENADRIFRVTEVAFTPDGGIENQTAYLPYPMKVALEEEIPEVEAAVRTDPRSVLVRIGDRTFEQDILCADRELFTVFSFPMVIGDAQAAFADRNNVILTETFAATLFPDGNAIGQTIEVRLRDVFETLTVAAIAEDSPSNTSVPFEMVVPFEKLAEASGWLGTRDGDWNSYSFYTWTLLREGAAAEEFEARMPALLEKYRPGIRERFIEQGRWEGEGNPRGFLLQPLADVHLDPSVMGGIVSASDPRYAYILGGIALALLLIACINFTTLAIGRSAGRAREVGVRKASGARRRQLMLQFWAEALLMTVLSLVLGLLLTSLALPIFNELSGTQLALSDAPLWLSLAILIGLALVVGLAAGSYPAVVLSSFHPVETLYGTPRFGGGSWLSRSLVVVQFALAMGLIAGTGVMVQQIRFLQEKNLGFDRENLVVVHHQGRPGSQMVAGMRRDLAGAPGIVGVTGVSSAFTYGWDRRGWDHEGHRYMTYSYNVDTDYLEVMGIPLVAGRFFDPARPADSTGAVVVNEAFVRLFGWTDPIGQRVPGFDGEPVIIGVVADVHNRSLHEEVAPILHQMAPGGWFGNTLVRIAPTDVPGALAAIESAWRENAPDLPVKYTFLDEDLQRQYVSERRWSRIVGYSGALAVLIACLGLFGLAALTVARRTKEIGIRKVLGATGFRVAARLSVEFARLVLVAGVIALPAAWLLLQRWLDGFAYAVPVSAAVVVGAAALVLTLAFVTVSLQSLRAANANPVHSLRYE